MYDIKIHVFPDGNKYCATLEDFQNLQDSPAGFGDTPLEAVTQLFIEAGMQEDV